MPDTQLDKKFPRTNIPEEGFLAGGMGLGIMCMGIWGITDGLTKWRLPFNQTNIWGSIVGLLFEIVWFGFLWFVFGRRFFPSLQTIHISGEEVRCQLGPIVLWRLPFSEIHTVIRTGSPVADSHAPPKYVRYTEKRFRHLVFSTVGPGELRHRCRSLEAKNRDRAGRFRMEHRMQATNEEIKRWHERRLLFLRRRMEWTEEAESALRKQLTTTTFIL